MRQATLKTKLLLGFGLPIAALATSGILSCLSVGRLTSLSGNSEDSLEKQDLLLTCAAGLFQWWPCARRFGLEHPADKQTRIAVVETDDAVLGFMVDAVSEVLRIPADTIEPPPGIGCVEREPSVSGDGRVLDPAGLIAASQNAPRAAGRTLA